MKKILVLFMTLVLIGSVAVATNTQKDAKAQQKAYEKIQKEKLKAEAEPIMDEIKAGKQRIIEIEKKYSDE